MLLVADIGNTNTVISLYDGNKWIETQRFVTGNQNLQVSVKKYLENSNFDKAVITSVVPKLTDSVKTIFDSFVPGKTLVIKRTINSGLVKDSIPEELGSDLLCNLIAAHYYYPDDFVLVADFGTAFTTSTVDPKGNVLGVTISPGLNTSVKALFLNTAQLPDIELKKPDTVLGRNSVDSIRAGIIYGFSGQLEFIVKQVEKETNHNVKVITTGGLSHLIQLSEKKIEKNDIMFTLDGARIASMLNN